MPGSNTLFRWTGSPARSPSPKERRGREAGFTLLEVVAALTILSLFLGTMLQIISGGFRATTIARVHGLASMLATSRLEAVGSEIPLVPGDTGGVYENGWRWRVRIQPLGGDGAGGEEEEGVFIPYLVLVAVEWESGRRTQDVTLTSVRLATPAAPLTQGERP